MAAIDIVNRVFREFKRYTGDGLPGEPLNAPLPIGDPQSGPHNPKKSEMRAALLAPIVGGQEAAQAVIDANLPVILEAKDIAVASAADAVIDAHRAEAAAEAVVGAVPTVFVANRAAMKVLDTSQVTAAYLKEVGREGQFLWVAGNFTTQIGADPAEGIYVKATAVDASAGAWVRKFSELPNVRWWGANAVDLYTGAQAAINTLAVVGGKTIRFPGGAYALATSLICTADDFTILLDDDCIINHNTPDFMALQMKGARGVVRGGINGGFVGPAAWDPVDGSGSLTYAVIRFTGEFGRVERTRIFNIRRVGIQFKDVNNGVVEGCLIDGNQPQPVYPLVLTNLHAIHLDAGTEASAGNFRVCGNTIQFCTQGINLANFGTGGSGTFGNARGCVFSNNIFYNMWDHGIYTNYADGITITGNNFNDCHTGVAASGPRHTISCNSFVALSTSGGEWHVAAVSLRDPQYCVVSDNVFFGTLTVNSPICIDLASFNTDVSYNVVANNAVRTVGRGTAIRLTYRSQASYFVYDNIVEGNNIVSQGRPNEGAIHIEGNPASSGVVNVGNLVRGNRISVEGTADNAHGIAMQSCASSMIVDNITKISYGAATPAASSGIALHSCTDVKTSGNLVVVPAGQGANVAVTGLKETGSCLRNEARQNRSALTTAAAGFTYVEVSPVSGTSKLLVDYEGIGVPSAAVRTGSRYTRLDGGNATSLYINQGDGLNWAGK